MALGYFYLAVTRRSFNLVKVCQRKLVDSPQRLTATNQQLFNHTLTKIIRKIEPMERGNFRDSMSNFRNARYSVKPELRAIGKRNCVGRKFEYFGLKSDHQLFLTLELPIFAFFVIDAHQGMYIHHFTCSKP